MIANPQVQSFLPLAISCLAKTSPMAEHDKQLIERLVEHVGASASEIARAAGLTPSTLTRPLHQPVKHRLSVPTLEKLQARYPDFPSWPTSPSSQNGDVGDCVDMVGIQHIDMAYGMGITFAVDHPEVEVLQFPVQWIRTITHSPPAMLTWTRGKGDSMEPTIRDGDLVLLDRSQRALTERDALWAFTIGEEAAIKRLRRQGEKCQILSDNSSVPPDEQMLRDMNIVGRVVFVGSRK